MGIKSVIVRCKSKISRLPKKGKKNPVLDLPQGSVTATATPEEFLAEAGYCLLRIIGEGGYGTVWMATVPGGRDPCALKIVKFKEGDRSGFDRERRAIELIQRLTVASKFLVPVDRIEVHEQHGFLSYVMPLADDVTGRRNLDRDDYKPRTLSSELALRGRLPVEDCIAITKRVLGALKVLHAKGLIHRDIKPGNVIYLRGKPVLADFGLVAHERSDISQNGSPSNFPPEGVGAATGDLYAVAVLLYRLATNSPAEKFPTPFGSVKDERTVKLTRVFTMAGEKEPSHRYINVQAFEMALDFVLNTVPNDFDHGDAIIRRVFRRFATVPTQVLMLLNKSGKAKQSRRAKKSNTSNGMVRFKEYMKNIVETGRQTAEELSTPKRDYMNQDELAAVAENIYLAFERRIGHEPPLVKKACLMAQASMEPDKIRRELIIKKAAALGGGMAGTYAVLLSIGTVLGVGHGVIAGIIAFFVGVSIAGPLAVIITGAMVAGFAGWYLFRNDDPKVRADSAAKAMIAGVHTAIDEMWDQHGEQLSLV